MGNGIKVSKETVVSSGYKETLITFSPTLIAFMLSSFLIALTSNYIPITNSSPNKEQPNFVPRALQLRLTTLFKRKNSDANPLFIMQLKKKKNDNAAGNAIV